MTALLIISVIVLSLLATAAIGAWLWLVYGIIVDLQAPPPKPEYTPSKSFKLRPPRP